MKNPFTGWLQLKNLFGNGINNNKAFLMLLFFAVVAYYGAKAQVAPPACNIVGPLTACAMPNPNDTSHDFIIYIEVARSTPHSTISYSFESNTSGAFIRKDLHGTILIPHSTATGLTIARANGVYDSAADYTYDTLVVFPGSMGYEFNLQVNDTTLDTTNNSCECSKSVSVAMIGATALYDTIPCFGGTTTLTVNSFGSGNGRYDDSLYMSGQLTLGEPNPDSGTATFPGIGAGNYMLHIYSPTDMCAFDTVIDIHQAAYNPLVLNCAHNDTVASCQTQAAVDSELLAWLSTASITGGTNVILINSYDSDDGVPSACGGDVTVTFTATSNCDTTQTCTATFTVTAAPSLSITTPANDSVASCQSQATVNAEFATWLATFSYSGGCNATSSNNSTGAPPACGGTTTVDFTVASSCSDTETVSATFTVRSAPSISITTPANDTVASCQTQAAVNAEYAIWLATFGHSGGCDATSSNNNAGAPPACGGTTTVDFKVASLCADTQTVSANFTVRSAPSLSLTTPANDTVASCQTQAEVNAEFATWLATFGYSGGCDATSSNNSTGAPAACGGTTTVDFKVASPCADTETVSANFTVRSAPSLSITTPSNDTVASCQTQGAVDTEYTAWLATFSYSGGCNATSSNNSTGAPLACGGTTTVDFKVASPCADTQTVSANFTVPVTPPFTLNVPANDTVASCQSQSAVDSEFSAWLSSASVTGSCGTSVINNYNSDNPVPSACGGSVTIQFSATSICRGIDTTASATFTVKQSPSVTLNTPANDTVPSCQTQAAVNAEFATWLATFSYSGGCNDTSSNNNAGAPQACGGTTTVEFKVTNSCANAETVSANFTVRSAPSISITTPANDTVASCQTQTAVNAEFAIWLATFNYSGGCGATSSNNSTVAPPACGGTTTVDFKVASLCADTQTVSANFTVRSAPSLSLTTPANDTVASCQTQGAIDTEYTAWLATFSYSGGCNASSSNNSTGAPLACGGTTTVDFKVASSCADTQTVSANFTVPVTPAFSLSIPANDTVASCQSQAAIDAEFTAWLNSASVSGSCGTSVLNNYDSDLGIPSACGGSITIAFSATSVCRGIDTTASATFTVKPAPSITLNAPANDTVASCQTQAAVNAEFATWLAIFSYSGGCNDTSSNNNTGAPLACGGTTTVEFKVTSSCANAQTVSANFTVRSAPSISITTPANDTVASCQTQAAVDLEYATWLATFSYSGGCSATSSNNSTGAPLACGGTTTVVFKVASLCVDTQMVSANFTVPSTQVFSLNIPANDTVTSCQTQAAVDAEFAAWLASASVGGGCGASISNNYNTDLGEPSACGGSITIIFTASSPCVGDSSVSATFIVSPAPSLILTAPPNDTAASCQNQTTIEIEYISWLSGFSSSGGCNTIANYTDGSAPSSCGGSTTITLSVSSTCADTQSVNSTFVVPTVGPITLTVPANDTVPSCQRQEAVDSEFVMWLAMAQASGGCGTIVYNDYDMYYTGAPAACGSSVTIIFMAAGTCGNDQFGTSTFIVLPSPAVTLNVPPNDTVVSCQTQGAVDTAFNAWLASASASGGCSGSVQLTNNYNSDNGFPSACGASWSVTFTATSTCGSQSQTVHFVVRTPQAVNINAPVNDTVASCQSQAAVDLEFNAWLASASVSGGCGASLSNNYTSGFPSSCGGSMTITWTATSNCQANVVVSRTFTVPASTPVSLNTPKNDTVASCQTQGAVDTEFNAWLTAAFATGGCGTTVSNNWNSDIGYPSACGGSLTIIWTAASNCQADVMASATFKVPAAPSLSLTAPANDTVAACQTQVEVNAEFAAWLTAFGYSGGCNATASNNNTGAPVACGGTTTVTFTVASTCADPQTVSANFTVSPEPALTYSVTNYVATACHSQGYLDTVFFNWLNTAVTASGGCNPQINNDLAEYWNAVGYLYCDIFGVCTFTDYLNDFVVPSSCGGSDSISFTITDNCQTIDTSAIFKVLPAASLTITAPANDTVASCQSQAAVNSEFDAWLSTFSYSGGCSPSASNNSTGAPLSCGGSTTVDFYISDICGSTQTVSSTFTVTSTVHFALSVPGNDTVASCQSQAAIDSEFTAWLATASISGSCGATLSNDSNSDHTVPASCGGSVTIAFTASSICGGDTSANATFTVSPPLPLVLNVPLNDTVPACQSQADVDSEFVNWLATASASGGCGAIVFNDFDILFSGAPSACGASLNITFIAEDNCGDQSGTGSANFTVLPPSSPLTLNVPANDTVPSCQTQAAIDSEYTAWIALASAGGGCSSNLSYSTADEVPSACGGSAGVAFSAASTCDTITEDRTFTVLPPAAVNLTMPSNDTVASCQNQSAVDSEFNAWLNSAVASGGCLSQTTNNFNPTLEAIPSVCGGSITVTFTATSLCSGTQTVKATFVVPTAPDLFISIQPNDTVEPCQSQAAVNAEFAAWFAGFSVGGGCNTSVIVSNDTSPSACGGTTDVIWTISSSCEETEYETSIFAVRPSAPLVISVPANDTVASCQTQAVVNSEFTAWLAGFSYSGGCNATAFNNNPVAPSACGGSTTVDYTILNSCGDDTTVSATFTVNPASLIPLTLYPPANDTVPSCQSQTVVDSEFTAWVATFSYVGGCGTTSSNNNTGAPLACGGSDTVDFTVTTTCGDTQTVSATFTVNPASASTVVLDLPLNDTVASCQTQTGVNAEFSAWLSTFSYSGGCSNASSNNNTGAPPVCGGSTTVTFTVTSSCQNTKTGSATFTVSPPLPLVLNTPVNDTVASCQSQADVDSEFVNWLATASASGGCGDTVYNDFDILFDGTPSACGGSITITFIAAGNCAGLQSGSATFAVGSGPSLTLNAPANDTVPSCQTQADIDSEYIAWIALASTGGGCSSNLSYATVDVVPSPCGGSASVAFTATSTCDTITVSRNFMVLQPAPVNLTAPSNDTVASCQSQSAVDSEFNAWLASATVSGGCGASLSDNYDTDFGYPSACGGSIIVTWTASSNCQGNVTASSTFTVPTPVPLTMVAPVNDTVASCQTQSAVDSEFAAWLTSYTVSASDSVNLVYNGDFALGNVGFTSGYTFVSESENAAESNFGLALAGTYAVDSDANNYHPLFTGFDHTNPPHGKFMIVNGATQQTTAWEQTVNGITPHTNYIFSAWVSSMSAGSPAQLLFSINGNQLGSGNYTAPSGTGVWTQFTTTWNSGNNTSADIASIVDENLASGGNDFGIDDISLILANTVSACNNSVTNNSTGAPLACGGSATVTFSDSGSCLGSQTASATFTVNPASTLTLSIANDTVASCQTQDAVNAEFYAWLASVNVSGGCGTYSSNDWYDLFQYFSYPPSACGDNYIIYFYAVDNCGQLQSQFANFVVPSAPVLTMGSCSSTNLSCYAGCHRHPNNTGSVSAGAIANNCGTVTYSWADSSGNIVGTTATVSGLSTGTYYLTASDNCNSVTCSATISAPSAMTMGQCSHTNLPCNLSCNRRFNFGSVSAGVISNSVGTVTYIWVNDTTDEVVGTTATVIGLPAGSYTLTVTDSCTTLYCTQVINQPSAMTMGQCSHTNLGCNASQSHNKGSVSAGVVTNNVGPVSYVWVNDSTDEVVGTMATVTGLPAGSYTLTATDSCSTLYCTQVIHQPVAMSMGQCSHTNLGCNATCKYHNKGSVSAGVISNNNGPVSYAWVNDSTDEVVGTTATVTGLPAGTYTLTASDSCTTLTCSQTIMQPPLMTMGSCTHANLPCNPSCKRSNNLGSVSAGVVANNNGTVSYVWVNDANDEVVGTTATVIGLPSGTYTLTVSDSCSSLTCSQTINAPPVMTMGPCTSTNLPCNASCRYHNTGSVSAGVISNNNGPVSYFWVNDSTDKVVGTTATVTGLPSGTYTLTASDSCSTLTCSQTITQPPVMVMGQCTSTSLPCNSSCNRRNNGGSVSAGTITNNNGHVSYVWVNDSTDEVVGTTATVTGLPASNYTLTASDSCGSLYCTVTIMQPAAMQMGPCSSTNLPCNASCKYNNNTGTVSAGAIINANGPVTYIWVNDASDEVIGTTSTVTGLPVGTYTLTASDNCSSLICSETISSPPLLEMGSCSHTNSSCHSSCGCGTGTLTAGAVTDSNGIVSYFWVNDSTNEVVGTGAEVTGLPPGTYTLTASDNCSSVSCSETINCKATRDDDNVSNSTTPPDAANAGFDVVIYPNPFSSQFHLVVQSESSQEIDLKILDVTGQLVYQTRGVPAKTEILLGDQFATGAYIVEVYQGDVKKVLRLIKTN